MEKKTYTITEYVKLINSTLNSVRCNVIGEISEIKHAVSGHVYFTIKDKETNDVLSCIIWKSRYELSGVKMEIGMEVLIRGVSNIYGPSGKFSFIADTVSLIGEGALMKAYKELKVQLTKEGLFSEERKRTLPEFPLKIGVITSLKGAVIHDFCSNLGKFGFKVKIMGTMVEGQESGRDLILSVRAFKKQDIDILVLIRGGGSIQSLSGFDNEILVREIADFPVPVIAGIGHHEDIPLSALVSDVMVSTPTKVAEVINRLWEKARDDINDLQDSIFDLYSNEIDKRDREINSMYQFFEGVFSNIFIRYNNIKQKLKENLVKIDYKIKDDYKIFVDFQKIIYGYNKYILDNKKNIKELSFKTLNRYLKIIENIKNNIEIINKLINTYNPINQLKLGYSIIKKDNKIIKTINQLKLGDDINIQFYDGVVSSEIKNKYGKNKSN